MDLKVNKSSDTKAAASNYFHYKFMFRISSLDYWINQLVYKMLENREKQQFSKSQHDVYTICFAAQ